MAEPDAEPITSLHNPQVRLARSLLEAAGRRRHGAFLVEGLRLVEAAAGAATPRLVLHTPEFGRANARERALLRRLRAAGVAVRPVAAPVLGHVADTVTPQGIVAVVPLPEGVGGEPSPPAPLPQGERGVEAGQARPPLLPSWEKGRGDEGRRDSPGTRLDRTRRVEGPAMLAVVLDAIADPGNAGTLLRSAAAAGATLVVATRGTVDLYAPKVVRAGAGAHFAVPLVAGQAWEAIGGWLAQRRGPACQVLLADARAATPYWDVDWTRPSALIVSNEAHGASAGARAVATATVAIPMRGTESLNAAVAGSIMLFEALRQRCRGQGSGVRDQGSAGRR